ncbi:hypothetical protein V1514DRAFT_327451 [Lipomyces japonicus]|uniref:uncharacterized protein n=1 Tax=Lipomyces japonicus TaxID=56871 RepID=UPI0034CEA2D8
MKLISQHLDKDGCGSIKLEPQEPADLWHAYNLIQPGDKLRAPTFRRITKDNKGQDNDADAAAAVASGSGKAGSRISLVLGITVIKTDFDPDGGALHASGQVSDESPHVRVGAHHTLDLSLHRAFTLTKTFEAPWDSVSLQTVQAACDPAAGAEVGAVVLQQSGLANVCLVTEHMTLVRQRIDVSIPRKRAAATGSAPSSAHDRAVGRFYDTVVDAMSRHFDYSTLKAVVLASPGFSAGQLLQRVMDHATKQGLAAVLRAKPKFVVVSCGSGHVHALNQVLREPAVMAKLADTKFARETVALNRFFAALNDADAGKAWYGPNHVHAAVRAGAVQTLLISDRLFRHVNDVRLRRHYVDMVDQVRAVGGEVLVFSSLHESGKQLDQFTGVAAILRFAMPELEDIDSESDDENDGS